MCACVCVWGGGGEEEGYSQITEMLLVYGCVTEGMWIQSN